jgi:hypothetical protein
LWVAHFSSKLLDFGIDVAVANQCLLQN